MFKTLLHEGYPTFSDYVIPVTEPIKLGANMNIGLVPFHFKNYKLQPYVTERHVNAMLAKVAEQLFELSHTAEVVSLQDLTIGQHPTSKTECLEYIGKAKYDLAIKIDLVATPDFLHNFVWMHCYSGTKYQVLIASKAAYAYGADAHLDYLSKLTIDAVAEAAANAKNIAFDFEIKNDKEGKS